MDKELINEKLESLRRCVQRIETRRPDTAEKLSNDLDMQDIVSINLSRAVQLCVDIASHIISEAGQAAPNTMGESFDVLATLGVIDSGTALRMRKAVGFRNIATHNYEKINWEIVFNLCKTGPEDLKHFAQQVVTRL